MALATVAELQAGGSTPSPRRESAQVKGRGLGGGGAQGAPGRITSSTANRSWQLLRDLDLMVLDGTNRGALEAEHIDPQATRALLAATRPRAVLFTHVGHAAPPHEELSCRVRAAWPFAGVAHDGLVVQVGG